MYGEYSLRDLQTFFDFPGSRLENPLPLIGLNPDWDQPPTRRELWGVASGIAGGRLTYLSSTLITYTPFSSNYIEVNSELVPIINPFAGPGVVIVGYPVGMSIGNASANHPLIDASGAAVAGGAAGSTTYYAYVSNSKAHYAPNSLKLSTTPPTSPPLGGLTFEHGQPISTTFVQTGRAMLGPYLRTTGNARNWRFVGYVRTNASAQFADSGTQRFTINYYNRRKLTLTKTEATASWTYTLSSFRPWNNSTANRVEFVANGEDPVFLLFTAYMTSNGFAVIGIDLDGTTTNDAVTACPGSGSTGPHRGSMISTYNAAPSMGYHFLQLLEATDTGTMTFYGAESSPTRQSGATGWVMG